MTVDRELVRRRRPTLVLQGLVSHCLFFMTLCLYAKCFKVEIAVEHVTYLSLSTSWASSSSPHFPACTSFTPSCDDPRQFLNVNWHRLSYVRPSLPHTGLYTRPQETGHPRDRERDWAEAGYKKHPLQCRSVHGSQLSRFWQMKRSKFLFVFSGTEEKWTYSYQFGSHLLVIY